MSTAPKLRARTRLRSDEGTTYETEAPLARGGFGATYVAYRLSGSGRRSQKVCIKVCKNRHDWHGEAFFGRLLADSPRVVQMLDAFVAPTGSGSNQRRRYVIVFEYMKDGTVWRWSSSRPGPGPRPGCDARSRRC